MKLGSIVLVCLFMCLAVKAQDVPQNVLSFAPPVKVRVKAGASASVTLPLTVAPGYHINSNAPKDEFLIPISLKWTPGALQGGEVKYPAAEIRKLGFSEKPVSIFSGTFDLTTKFDVPADAPTGVGTVTGKLHFQACNDRMCLAPKTITVELLYEVVK
jgi:hypothetical protein